MGQGGTIITPPPVRGRCPWAGVFSLGFIRSGGSPCPRGEACQQKPGEPCPDERPRLFLDSWGWTNARLRAGERMGWPGERSGQVWTIMVCPRPEFGEVGLGKVPVLCPGGRAVRDVCAVRPSEGGPSYLFTLSVPRPPEAKEELDAFFHALAERQTRALGHDPLRDQRQIEDPAVVYRRLIEQRWAHELPLLLPNSLRAAPLTSSTGEGVLVQDGDTLCCACARGRDCHRRWAAPFLKAAGWQVFLDGVEVQ